MARKPPAGIWAASRYVCLRVFFCVSAVLLITLIAELLRWNGYNSTHKSSGPVQGVNSGVDDADAAARQDLCQRHGWSPFEQGAGTADRRKVYDLITVDTELDWLELRLNATYDYVDYYIIVESPKTAADVAKPLVVRENMGRFAAYAEKIVLHELEIPSAALGRQYTATALERLQRDAAYRQVFPGLGGTPRAPARGDVILVADVDEIVRPDILVALRACDFPPQLTLMSHMFRYSYQFLNRVHQWPHPQVTYYRGEETIDPTSLRDGNRWTSGPGVGAVWGAGWRCATCYPTVEEMLAHMAASPPPPSSSYSGLWPDSLAAYGDPDRVADRVRSGRDLWNRRGLDQEYERVDVDADDGPGAPGLPFLRDNSARFAHLLDRDGPAAGFRDYYPGGLGDDNNAAVEE